MRARASLFLVLAALSCAPASRATDSGAAGSASTRGAPTRGGFAMAQNPFFQPVEVQLIQTPAASRAILDAAKQGKPVPPTPPEAAFPIDQARSWAVEVLRAPYSPPANAPFLAFQQEDGRFDVVRGSFEAGGLHVEIAETKYLLSIEAYPFPVPDGVPDERRAEEAAKQLLTAKVPIVLKNQGGPGKGSYGDRVIGPGGRVDPQWPQWVDALRWWASGDRIGFLTIKALGGPTREVINGGEAANKVWFVQ